MFRVDLTPERAQELAAELQRLVGLQLTHPAIAAPIAAGVEGTVAYLAEPYVAAESLDVALRQFGPAPFDDVLRLTTQLAGAIDFAGAVGAHHGGLHPRDVLVSTDEIRVTGFGVLRALERVAVRGPVRRPYTAPERTTECEWGRPADVYSLAAIAHELLLGRRIAGSSEQIVENITVTPGADSHKVREAFARALANQPADRFPNALSFATALRDAAGDVSHDATVVQTRRVAQRIPSPRPDRDERSIAVTGEGDKSQGDSTVVRKAGGSPASIPALPFGTGEAEGGARQEVRAIDPDALKASSVTPPTLPYANVDQPSSVEDLPFRSEDPPPRPFGGEPPMKEPSHSPAVEPTPPAVAAFLVPDVQPPPPPSRPFDEDEDEDEDEHDVGRSLSVDRDVLVEPANIEDGRARRSSLVPMAALFVLGLMIGSLGGYQYGSRRGAATDSGPQVAAASSSAVGRDATEVAVEPSRAPATPTSAAPTRPGSSSTPRAAASPPRPGARPSAPTRSRPDRAESAAVAATTGRMLVRSTPAGAQVMVNGEERGTTPVTLRNLPYGTHTIRVMRRGYAPVERRVRITKSRPASSVTFALSAEDRAPTAPSQPASNASFIGSLSVDSRPPGATVFLNGQRVGETPTVLQDLKAGSYALRLERSGYVRWSASVRIVTGQLGRVTASLDRAP